MKRPFKKQATESLLFLGFTLVLLLVWLFLSSPEKSFLEVIKDLALTFLLPVGLTLLIPISILGIMFLFHKLFPLSQQEPIQLGEEDKMIMQRSIYQELSCSFWDGQSEESHTLCCPGSLTCGAAP